VKQFALIALHWPRLAVIASAIELFSAGAVLWRFNSTEEQAEATAIKITGWLLIALAAYIAIDSLYTLLAVAAKPRSSYVGIVLLVAAVS
jgi:uncharacterized membrane protein